MPRTIRNNLTNQGFSLDVEKNFDITLPDTYYTASQMRLLVASESLAHKVVSYLPRSMGNVAFSVFVSGRKRQSKGATSLISSCNNELKKLIPWFVDAQTEANIVGKAYLVLDFIEDSSEADIAPSMLVEPIVWDKSLDSFSLKPLVVIPGDSYQWDKSRSYLHNQGSLGEEDFTLSLIKEKAAKASSEYSFIEKSHVIEFTAFDNQDRRSAINSRNLTRKLNSLQQDVLFSAFRLTRFVPALLRYLSFISATLNRMHRSEAVVYKKENLGNIGAELAKYVSAQGNDTSLSPLKLENDVTRIIEEELERIQKCLTNFGVVLIDGKNSVDMIARNMTGIDQLQGVFKHDLIASSGLTEFALFGVTGAGSGLSSLDIRDRSAIAKQTDQLFSDHWLPVLGYLANCLLSGSIQNQSVGIEAEQSFKLSELETSEWLDKRIKVLLDLLAAGVMDTQMVQREIASNNLLGRHFMFRESDIRET